MAEVIVPFVGRAAEVAAVTRAVASAPSAVLVEGEAGVGKSRLLAEALAGDGLRGRRVLAGACQPLREPFPLGAFVNVLRCLAGSGAFPHAAGLSPVAGTVAGLVPELTALLPPPPPIDGDPRAQRHRLFRGVVELLAAAGDIVVVIEDLHWADEGSLDLLRFLTAELPDETSMVVTSRPGEGCVAAAMARAPARVGTLHVRLEPFDLAEASEFVSRSLDGQPVSSEFASFLWEKTAGLPFVLEEVLGLLRARGQLIRNGGRWVRRELGELAVPVGFAATIRDRLDDLDQRAALVLRALAVLGVPADETTASAVCAQDAAAAAAAFTAGLDMGLLVEAGGRVDFRHDLARQAVYAAIPGPLQRRLHAAAAEVLVVSGGSPAALARHCRLAGRAEWLGHCEAAAALASSLGDDLAATAFLEEILTADAVPADVRARAAITLGRTALHALEHDRGVALLDSALGETALTAAQRGDLRLSYGWMLYQAGQAGDAFHAVEEAVTELADEPGLLARALATLAMPWTQDGTLAGHQRWMAAALAAADRQEDSVVTTAVLVDQAYLATITGDFDASRAAASIPQEGRCLPQWHQIVRGHHNLCEANAVIGDYAAAAAHHEQGVRLSQQLGYHRLRDGLSALGCLLRHDTGDVDGLDEANRRASPPGCDERLEAVLVGAERALMRGDHSAGEAAIAELVVTSQRAGQHHLAARAAGALAAAHVVRGAFVGAVDSTGTLLELVRRKGVWAWAADLVVPTVQSLLLLGRRVEAQQLVVELDAGISNRRAPAAAAALKHAHGLLAPPEHAAAALSEARVGWAALPRPLWAARAGAAAGAAALAVGSGGAEGLLRHALGEFLRLGAAAEANQVRAVLRRHGLAVHVRRGRIGYGNALSPREREVARLAAAGKTNREIAEALFLSPRTVGNQLASVLRKLALASRTDLDPAMWEDDGASTPPHQ